jgi:hypothetical protein
MTVLFPADRCSLTLQARSTMTDLPLPKAEEQSVLVSDTHRVLATHRSPLHSLLCSHLVQTLIHGGPMCVGSEV